MRVRRARLLRAGDADRTERLLSTDTDLGCVLHHLARPGKDLAFSDYSAPVLWPGAGPGTGTTFRWAHVRDAKMQQRRRAYAELLHARIDSMDKPMPVAPPPGMPPACMFCGIGTVDALRRNREDVWGEPLRFQPFVFGGERTPEPALGHLCLACASGCVSAQRVMGRTALENAIFAYLRAKYEDNRRPQSNDLLAWFVMPEGTPPNRTPWAHTDLDEIVRPLQNIGWTGRSGLRPDAAVRAELAVRKRLQQRRDAARNGR